MGSLRAGHSGEAVEFYKLENPGLQGKASRPEWQDAQMSGTVITHSFVKSRATLSGLSFNNRIRRL